MSGRSVERSYEQLSKKIESACPLAKEIPDGSQHYTFKKEYHQEAQSTCAVGSNQKVRKIEAIRLTKKKSNG